MRFNKLAIAWVLALLPLAFAPRTVVAAEDDLYKELKPLVETITLIQGAYVDEDKTKSKALIAGAIKGMVQTLDPFSQYLDVQEATDMKQDTQGSFGGLGIEISIKNRQLTVVSPIEDTPAQRAGIKPSDLIIRINHESTDGMALMDAVHKLRGVPGTKVTITIVREGEQAPRELTLIRAVIKVKAVKFNMLPGDVGYIRLASFMGRCDEDFADAIEKLKGQGAKRLIVDLRNNPGGLLDASSVIAGNFVPKGKLVVYTDGRFKSKNLRFESTGPRRWPGPLVLLINGGSASASEILAGAIQDHGLGVIVGSKSFGKGSVQTILPLDDGSAIRLTTARFLTPKGKLIHGNGITPDVLAEEELLSKAYLDLYDGGLFEAYAKDYLLRNPEYKADQVEEDKDRMVKVSENDWEQLKPETRETRMLKDFADFAKGKGKPLADDDLARDRTRLLGKVREEMVRLQKGEDAARSFALLNDSQVRRALDVLKVVEISKNGNGKGSEKAK